MSGVVHPAHNRGQADCTHGVVSGVSVSVHPVYMGQNAQRKPKAKAEGPKRWRETCIRHWRSVTGLTLEEASERLSKAPYHLETGITHASLQRVENGLQMPKVELIEALAHLYGTDIHALLNLLPTVPNGARDPGAGELARIWESAEPAERARIINVVKATVGD